MPAQRHVCGHSVLARDIAPWRWPGTMSGPAGSLRRRPPELLTYWDGGGAFGLAAAGADSVDGVAEVSFGPNSHEYTLPWDPASAGIPYDVTGAAFPERTWAGLPFWPNRYE
jgi:hypothetical protein